MGDRQQQPARSRRVLQDDQNRSFGPTGPITSESGKISEALAVQSFEEGLSAVNLIDQPMEYAMLQNNLGNALQYASSGSVAKIGGSQR